MHATAPLPPHLAAYAPLLDAIAQTVRAELAAARDRTPSAAFGDKHSSGLGPSVFLAAARTGEFETFRVGKRFVAREADVRAYIERQRVAPRTSEAKLDELDVQLGRRLRPGGRANRVARSKTSSER
ncbi:MAG: hypothetical protein NVS3B10_17190 [Polyangiales bacterium]